MSVILRLSEELQRYASAAVNVHVDRCTIHDALQSAFRIHPLLESRVIVGDGRLQPYLRIYHNDRLVDPGVFDQHFVENGDTIDIFALAAGG